MYEVKHTFKCTDWPDLVWCHIGAYPTREGNPMQGRSCARLLKTEYRPLPRWYKPWTWGAEWRST